MYVKYNKITSTSPAVYKEAIKFKEIILWNKHKVYNLMENHEFPVFCSFLGPTGDI